MDAKKNLFEKIVSKRGSVLFIVLVLMSVMIIVASAVYYVVSSNRQTVVMTYSDVQAYETAVNVLDLLENVLLYESVPGTTNAEYEDLYNAIDALIANAELTGDYTQKLTANLNNQTSAMPGGIGELIDVEISVAPSTQAGAQPDDFDVLMKVNVTYNGKTVTVTRTFGTKGVAPKSPKFGFSKVFAATGKESGETFLKATTSISDIHFDYMGSDVSKLVGASEGGRVFASVSAKRSLIIAGTEFLSPTPATGLTLGSPPEINVMENLEVYRKYDYPPPHPPHFVIMNPDGNDINGAYDMRFNNGGIMRVGGDLIIGEVNEIDMAEIYVFGNLNQSNAINDGIHSTQVYVLGSVSASNAALAAALPMPSVCSPANTAEMAEKAEDGTLCPPEAGCVACDQYKLLCEKSSSPQYEALGHKIATSATTKTIDWTNTSNDFWGTAGPFTATVNGAVKNFTAGRQYLFYINQSCTLSVDRTKNPTQSNNNVRCVLIDTGNDPNKILEITLKGDGSGDFSWSPSGKDETEKYAVLLMGKGTVLFKLEDDPTKNPVTKYIMQKRDAVLPYNMMVAPDEDCWLKTSRGGKWLDGDFQSTGTEAFINALIGWQCCDPNTPATCLAYHREGVDEDGTPTGFCDGFMALREDLTLWNGAYTAQSVVLNGGRTDAVQYGQTLTIAANGSATTSGTTPSGFSATTDWRIGSDGVNNNIFFISGTPVSDDDNSLIANSKARDFEMEMKTGSFTTGFIYAPYGKYENTNNNDDGATFFGGMIVSTLKIADKRIYIGVRPNNDWISQFDPNPHDPIPSLGYREFNNIVTGR